MKFWDTSCIIPICLHEPSSVEIRRILKEDQSVVVWWATGIESISAITRRVREGTLNLKAEEETRTILSALRQCWTEVQPTQKVREIAERLLAVHPLRTADALQLAAALVWVRQSPGGSYFVCLDHVLRDAARKEGFTLLPNT